MHPTFPTTLPLLLLLLPHLALSTSPQKREVVNAPPSALAATPTQVSPVTTMMVWATPIAPGAPARQVQVVYSQAFDEVPDQWEGPAEGKVGLGGIKGKVGVVKSKAGGKLKMKMKRTAMGEVGPEPTTAVVGRVEMVKRVPEPKPEAFVILPPPTDEKKKMLEKRKGGKGGGGGGGGDESAASGRVGGALVPGLVMVVGVVGAMVLA